MTIESPLNLSIEALAEALTHCFEGYIMPAHFTGLLLANMVRVEAIDLSCSLIASEGDGPVAIALIARRGKRARVAAMAVAPLARRKGVGKALMLRAIEDARKRGEEELILEVIEQNPAAIELYKQVGFEIQHRLIGFEGILREESEVLQPALIGPTKKTAKKSRAVKPVIKECSFSDVANALRQRGFLASSWSMSPATTEQLSGPSRAVKCGEIYAVIGVSGEEVVSCRTLGFAKSPSKDAIRMWLLAMAHEYAGKKLYIPAFFPEPEYAEAFADSGLKVGAITQFQMALSLTP
jgi:GNAT superfamily N-acetyltransferase